MNIRGSHHLLVLTVQNMGSSHAKTEDRHRLIRPTLGHRSDKLTDEDISDQSTPKLTVAEADSEHTTLGLDDTR
jgi:hypothetical protein